MTTNLLDISKGHFTDIAIAKAARLFGENTAETYKAINHLLPAFLGSMANKAASNEGANELMQHFKDTNKLDMSGPLGTIMGGGAQTEALMSAGSSAVSSIFGKQGGPIADWVATNSKIKIASASSLMTMVAPILMNLINKRSSLTGSSVMSLLNEQLPILRNANLPDGLVKAANLDFASVITARVDDETEESVDFTRFIPWVLGAAALLGGLFFFKTCIMDKVSTPIESSAPEVTAPAAPTPTATAPAPVAATPAVKVDSVHKLTLPEGIFEIPKGSFLDKLYVEITDPKADLTKPLMLDSVFFKPASARLRPESRTQVDELVKILKAYPTVEIKIDGHTDNFGIPDKNLRLSNIRAASVMRYLVQNGIAEARIATQGFGDAKPIGDNATPEGMAKNRRIEVFVTKK
jgi:OmpA-OmpF porin, OOP family